MKKNRPITPFLGGAVTALLAVSCLTTALAASGKVSYNFANVALDGETKITAGADITAANGQKVPGTILFTDAAGGKTNYLPIRAVSELLGVEIGYDSATKTILLGGQPKQEAPEEESEQEPHEPGSEAVAVSGRQWLRELKDGGIHYYWPKASEVSQYTDLPAFQPTWLPEGFALSGVGVSPIGIPNSTVGWNYEKDGKYLVSFTCYRPTEKPCGSGHGVEVDTAALLRAATVQGRSADFYQIHNVANLVWEDSAGNLFWLESNLDQATLEKIANSVKEVKEEALPVYQMEWIPDGFRKSASTVTPQMVTESWSRETQTEGQPRNRTHFRWYYSRGSQAAPAGTPEMITIKGIQAQYWRADPNAEPSTVSASETVISISTTEAQMNTLLWTDPQTNITFRLLAPLDKDVMIRMAESISPK